MKKFTLCVIVCVTMMAIIATGLAYATIQKETPQLSKEKLVTVEEKIVEPEEEVRKVEKPKPPTPEELEKQHLNACAAEYPTATKIWRYMRYELGWNQNVCAGVMGNIMAECGGQTLNIVEDLYAHDYYGMCQWSRKYHPDVIGTDLNYQLKYLKNTVDDEFKVFGHLYRSKFTYEDFTNLKTPETAALAFAQVYERCSSKTYTIRVENAQKAYNYFVN